MKVLMIGGSGFIGQQLGVFLQTQGYALRVLSRGQPQLSFSAELFRWQRDGAMPVAALAGVDAVVNLAGAAIAAGRWTAARKAEIVASRVQTTRALVTSLRTLGTRPVVVQASAIGYYGERGDACLSEDAAVGKGFLAQTAQQWEESFTATPLENRCLLVRLGMVLGDGGGALAVLRKIYRRGGGASLGSGQQYVSWVHCEDVCRFILYALQNSACHGVFNLTAPQAVTYDTLHHALLQRYRPWFSSPLRVPAWLLRLLLGEQASIVTVSQRVVPQRTLASGYKFRFTDIEKALAACRI